MERRGVPVEDMGVSLVSLFELQAKAAKLGVPSRYVVEAIDTINHTFRVEPFFNPKIVETSSNLLKDLNDYVDCLILATAIASKEDLVTEDQKILGVSNEMKDRYGVNIVSSKEFLAHLDSLKS